MITPCSQCGGFVTATILPMVLILGVMVAPHPAHAQKAKTTDEQWAEMKPVLNPDAESIALIRKAADQGEATAQLKLGFLYANGQGVTEDYAEAVKWYRKAADQGQADAQNNLGVHYSIGLGVPSDSAEAVKWYRRAADQGHAGAQNSLGAIYANGLGVSHDYVEAVKWYRKAADQGDADAQVNLGDAYHLGKGVSQDDAAAAKWYRKAADQGQAGAQSQLGFLYRDGLGVTQDLAEATKWFRKAADQGEPAAQTGVGLLYANGQGVLQDYAEATLWFRKAAAQGEAVAQNNLGFFYASGKGVAQDYAEAVKWYRKAANQGQADAQNNLGSSFVYGQGVPQDYAEAAKWLRSAATLGNSNALFSLGELYRVGKGVGQDVVEAYAFYNLASVGGNEAARIKRDAVAEVYLKGELLLRAQQRARQLKVELDAEKAKTVNPSQRKEHGSIGSQAPAAKTEVESSEAKGTGSGFVVGTGGFVVTNWHVVEKAARIELVTAHGRMAAKIIAVDQSNDLAILQSEKSLPSALPIRSSRGTKLGAEVFTIGFPNPDLQGFSPKFNRGEISSLAGPSDDPRYFQVSVPVQPGNSGGALCDAEGRVIGVVAAKLDERLAYKTSGSLPENVNYAIKSSYLLALLESLDLPPDVLAAESQVPLLPEAVRQHAQKAAVLVLVY